MVHLLLEPMIKTTIEYPYMQFWFSLVHMQGNNKSKSAGKLPQKNHECCLKIFFNLPIFAS